MTTQVSEAITKMLETRALVASLAAKEFPLPALLSLYLASPNELALNHFEGFRLLAKWLGPIERSKLEPQKVPRCFSTYECQELGVILGEHPSVIYQELYLLWKHST